MDDKKLMGERMKARREYLGLTQADVAGKLSVERATYAQYEIGRNLYPSTDLPKLARVLRCSTDFLLGEESLDDSDIGIVAKYWKGIPPAVQGAKLEELRTMYEAFNREDNADTIGKRAE